MPCTIHKQPEPPVDMHNGETQGSEREEGGPRSTEHLGCAKHCREGALHALPGDTESDLRREWRMNTNYHEYKFTWWLRWEHSREKGQRQKDPTHFQFCLPQGWVHGESISSRCHQTMNISLHSKLSLTEVCSNRIIFATLTLAM